MAALSGEKILLTGPAGQIAFPLARELAKDNEVWGLARFGNPEDRAKVEKVGLRTVSVDLAEPDFSEVPDDVDVVLHLAAAIAPQLSDDEAIRINAEGTGHLMKHVRRARACLVMSSSGVYADCDEPRHVLKEGDPVGTGVRTDFAPSYRVSRRWPAMPPSSTSFPPSSRA
jgi:nucleoside-diphosphate-sugar epimerase